ncbi:hypothetical protein Aab01nite_05760 [Paractinoplanes abujensis]|uniref:Methyltransferase family protein n=1 Tax=Paractinoplanes abujensis TaxID=882441 RepID=A0A7W7CQS8_9ACTN|nr:hypothetical protein [Actinoplanes abujensis]MBB4691595.1 hypothetical protein [Actinoplanes abujensis]GID16986.1 hypothetical protein Aab01nite_05760 [Actinoplanes abujensis]
MTTLIGGEMLAWSDLDGSHGPAPSGGDALPSLLATASGRTLVAGPHSPQVLAALPAADVTVLIRGDADVAAFTGPAVLCGSLEKLAAEPAFDTIIALDGLDRLHSAEAPPFTWDETFTQLLALLKPDGRLLLGHENLFGVHRLTALPPTPADADWVVPDDHDPARPAGHTRLLSRLTEAGLHVSRDYAAYPSLASPAVLLSAEALTQRAVSGVLSAALASAFRTTADTLSDPVRLSTAALRHDLAAALAPAWFVIAERGTPQPSATAPDAVIASAPVELSALPPGRTLNDHLLAAAQRRDLPAMRELLTAWQSGPSAEVPATHLVVTPASSAPAALTPLAPAGEPLTALRAFAAEAIAAGYAHLWPIPADEAELTTVLAGMTGRELDPTEVPPASPPAPHTIAGLLADRERLTRELAEAKAKHSWYEKMLLHREAELKRVRQMNALLSATVPGKAAAGLVGGLRAGKRAVRSVVRRTRGT